MLERTPIVLLVSTTLGFLSGLGTGGGSLLILWLTIAIGMDYPQARTLNLLFFLPAALIATIFRWKQCKLPIYKVLSAAAAGCVCAGVFAYAGKNMDITILKKLFGALLLFTGVRELFYRPRNAK